MDLLKDAAKNINLYEVKAYVRKAQNVAMNLTEMEAKVREATNNEPWGTSSTVKAQIAAGTYNYREREEIILFIFRRFTEKAANEWRQIYKLLELLEYLIKNGSERIIDDVRANLLLIQMLKLFHYIDSKGRDQGINVRNRAKTLINLLNDDALIRLERKKSRANAKKFGGVSSAAYGGQGLFATGQGGYDDDDYGSRVFGDGGVYGARYGDTADEYNTPAGNNDDDFEEYEVAPAGSSSSRARAKPTTATSTENAAPKQEADLLGDLMDFGGLSQPQTAAAAAPAADDDDDDFDDFQAAPSTGTGNLSNSLANLYVLQPAGGQQFQQPQPTHPVPLQQQQQQSQANYHVLTASLGPAKAAPKADAFSLLFSTAKSLAPHKRSSTPASPQVATPAAVDDDFFGGSAVPSQPTSTNPPQNQNNNSGEVDLLSF